MSTKTLIVSPQASRRRERALEWLAARSPKERLVVVAPGGLSGNDLLREATRRAGALFGWERSTLGGLAGLLAADSLAARGRTGATVLVRQALCARAIQRSHEEAASELGSWVALVAQPGFPWALARTLDELGMAGVQAEALAEASPPLAALSERYAEELGRARLADRAMVFACAVERLRSGEPIVLHPTRAPLLLYDLSIATVREAELVAALVARAEGQPILATAPSGDERSQQRLEAALGVAATIVADLGEPSTLCRVQRQLFESDATPGEIGADVQLLSTPGESREAVEIARVILAEAERGVPFDDMAVLLRSPEHYTDSLAEAFERAAIPAHFARGTLRPDPAGRAMLALLACAAEGLSASRFAEYLSLGMVPPASAAAEASSWSAPREEQAPWIEPELDEGDDPEAADSPSFPTPRRWERLLVDAAVIGGRDRWKRRLDGLAARLATELESLEEEAPRRESVERQREALAGLRRFALPLIGRLDALPERARWGRWVEVLGELAAVALRRPQRVLELLGELGPMAPIGPVGLEEVQLVLTRRLAELAVLPGNDRSGKVLVASPEETRGMAFDVVFVPGLAEKIFPRKVVEDPLALDELRQRLHAELDDNAARIVAERRALRLAVGAAKQRLVLSYPRIDVERSRPRVPSFYGLELLRAAEGVLPGFEELARRAGRGAAERMGWPAPQDPAKAIDASEYDLAVLERLLRRPPEESRGAARYLLGANRHLARSLRFRARRWKNTWTSADGLNAVGEATREALADYRLGTKVYSPTALELYARCPYRFYLSAMARLAPRPTIAPLEDIDPLVRGKLVHEVQAEVMREIVSQGAFTPARLDEAFAVLDRVVDEVAARFADELAPAIDRVWRDGVEALRRDMREWLARAADEPEWQPRAFELAFGLKGRRGVDEASLDDPVQVGVAKLRGSIDLVEERSAATGASLRATDYKTGRAPERDVVCIGGGKLLQPLLYALTLEQLEAAHGGKGREVVEGRLYYCTSRGSYEERVVPLDERARKTMARLLDHIDRAIEKPRLVAHPDDGACTHCDYIAVCGPREAQRVERKPNHRGLRLLRDEP